jgi:pyruvate ferredoxin oxidoreductase delta subunit
MKIKQGTTWRDVPIGGNILEPGTSAEYKTGAWRSNAPEWNGEICISCMNCWMFCPDMSIKLTSEGKVAGVDYDYCKGCGLCAKVCPEQKKHNGAHAMTMKQGGGDQ